MKGECYIHMLEKIFSLQQKGQKMRKDELEFDPEKQVIIGKRRILYFPLLISKFHKTSVCPYPITKISPKRIKTYYN